MEKCILSISYPEDIVRVVFLFNFRDFQNLKSEKNYLDISLEVFHSHLDHGVRTISEPSTGELWFVQILNHESTNYSYNRNSSLRIFRM